MSGDQGISGFIRCLQCIPEWTVINHAYIPFYAEKISCIVICEIAYIVVLYLTIVIKMTIILLNNTLRKKRAKKKGYACNGVEIMKKWKNRVGEWGRQINNVPIGKVDWILFLTMAVFIFFTLFYEDLIIIYKHSLTFLDSAFHLDLGNFYANTLENHYNGVGAVYYWTVYFVIGIWNLPIWILTQIFDMNVFSVKCMLWCKLEIVFFLVLSVWMLGKILEEHGFCRNNVRLAQFLFVSALMTVMPTLATGQVDIITVFMMLWGIYEYVKTDKITWKFLLIFSFAASLKIFALFVFIPLVLLKEKRILAVIGDFMAGLLFIALSLVPYAWRTDYHESSDFLTDIMSQRLFSTSAPGGNSGIPIFAALLVAITIWAYVMEVKEKEDYLFYVNWIALAVFANFFITVFAHPYWIVLLEPYLVIAYIQNGKRRKVNLILEFFINAAISFYYVGSFGVYITENSFSYLVLSRIGFTVNGGIDSAGKIIEKLGINLPVFYSIFAACMIAFLVINYPKYMPQTSEERQYARDDNKFDHGMIYLRLLLVLVFILANILVSYIV